MCFLHIVFCTVCKYVLSICKLLLFFCTVWSTLIRISLTKALVLWWCDHKSDLIWLLLSGYLFFWESTAYRLHIFSCKTSLIFHCWLYNCVCDKLQILNVLYSQQETEPACRGCRWASAPPLEQVRYCSSPHASFPTAVSTECVRRNPHSCPWFTQLEQPKYWNANVRATVISQYLL